MGANNSKKAGRPQSVSIVIDDLKKLEAVDGKIRQCFKSEVKKFSSGGGYIPIPKELERHEAFVIVTKKKFRKK
ncbi:hypothetical protein KY332_03240 [Candidatus Woesearchaeota archaeon]|nr:hypothetical protein [Candidatus Woesearchaeota archaeon]